MNNNTWWFISWYERILLKSQNFIIVSNNCWGFESYKTLNKPYNTPFVGLYLYPADYLKLIYNIEKIFDEELTFVTGSKFVEGELGYPVGIILDDVEIHFLHYNSARVAKDKWTRRLQRMKESRSEGAKLLFKMCDRDGCTTEDLNLFHQAPVVKNHTRISFGVKPLSDQHHIVVDEALSGQSDQSPDGLKLYQIRYQLFDFCHWVIHGRVRKSLGSRIFSLFHGRRN
jgi:uncharacterized protein (DUF1919 family)